MKYDAVTEIFANLRMNKEYDNNTEELIKNLYYFTKVFNFELGNMEERNYKRYSKTININNKKRKITLANPSKENEIEISYREKNKSIVLKFKNDKVYLNELNIKYPHGIYLLDYSKNKINYYDNKTIDYIKRELLTINDNYYLDQNSFEKYGLIEDEEIPLNDNNTEQIDLFKKLIENSIEENELLLENMLKEKNKVLIKNRK